MIIQNLTTNLLIAIGEDPSREGLQETPKNVAAFYKEFLYGYTKNPEENIKGFCKPQTDTQESIEIRDIEFHSICEHHLLPFFGKIAVKYSPQNLLIGFSEVVEICNTFAHRLQMQERMATQILNTLVTVLQPTSCQVQIEATHLCMAMWGVESKGSKVITTVEFSI